MAESNFVDYVNIVLKHICQKSQCLILTVTFTAGSAMSSITGMICMRMSMIMTFAMSMLMSMSHTIFMGMFMSVPMSVLDKIPIFIFD